MRVGDFFAQSPLLRVAVVLILGIIAGDTFGYLLPAVAGLLVSCGFLAAYLLLAWLCGRSAGRPSKPVLPGVLLLFAIFFLGFYLVVAGNRRLDLSFPEDEVAYEAVIASEPVVRGKVVQCELIVVGCGRPFRIRGSILRDTLTHRYERLHVGDGIVAQSVITSIPDSGFAGVSSAYYERWLRVRGIAGQTFIYYSDWRKARVSLRQLSHVERARLHLMRLRRHAVSALIDAEIDGDEGAVVAALVLGDKSSVAPSMRESYSRSGAAHVLALSGLHIGIIYFFLSWLFVRTGRRALGQIVTLPTIWMFALMAGFTPSLMRAATMITVYGCVSILRRDAFSLNTLSFAAIVILFFRPLALWDVSFQLSFMAVLGIIFFCPSVAGAVGRMAKRLSDGKIFGRLVGVASSWVLNLASVSIAAQVATAPLVAYYFGRFPTYFLLANFLAIPLVTMILYLSVVLFILLAFNVLTGISVIAIQSVVAQLIKGLSLMLNKGLVAISQWPNSSIATGELVPLQVAMLYVLLVVAIGVVVLLRRNYKSNRLMRMR